MDVDATSLPRAARSPGKQQMARLVVSSTKRLLCAGNKKPADAAAGFFYRC
jgi:hypothetical protein